MCAICDVCVFVCTYVFICVQFLCMHVCVVSFMCVHVVSVHIWGGGAWVEVLAPSSGSLLHTVFSTGQRVLCSLGTFYLLVGVAGMKVTLLLS